MGWLALTAMVFFGIHCLIPHKETRFILPVFPLFVLGFGYGLETFSGGFQKYKWERAVPALTLVAGLIAFYGVLARPLYLSSVDLTPIFSKIYHSEKSGEYPPQGCLLMVNYSWSWSRGSLGIGRTYEGEDRKVEDLKVNDFKCPWVVVQKGLMNQVRAKAEQVPRQLKIMMEMENGFVLLR